MSTVSWTEPATTATGLPLTTLVGTWVEERVAGVWTPQGGTVGDPTTSPSWRAASSPSGGGAQSHTFTPSAGVSEIRVGAIDVTGNATYTAAIPLGGGGEPPPPAPPTPSRRVVVLRSPRGL